MILKTIDRNMWYTLSVEHAKLFKEEPIISFELNNLHENVEFPIPDETTFIMSIEDAKELHAWLGAVLNRH